MNDKLQAELERLKERQAQLNHAVDLLGVHIKALEQRMAAEDVANQAMVVEAAVPEAGAPMAVPPVLPVMQQVVAAKIQSPEPTLDPSRDQNIERPTSNIEHRIGASAEPATFNLQPATVSAATPPPVAFTPPVTSQAAPARSESFEMRLGTYWLVRIGIVAMLTALVFFGTYAYQNYIGKIGPAGKVTLLYLASGALLGFGAWFQRRAAKESLRNYAQVLFAGGMAAVYFTTYAAHHFPNLQIIPSAKLDGALLLGWAGFMAWVADRKKSEVFALFAVGLAYYTSVITRVGHFTLYSNLVLAAVVLFFLVRNRWAKLSFASLFATYASYGFWRFYSQSGWHWAGPDEGLWLGAYFLLAYWGVFTAAVFLSRHKEFAGVNRATFITLNNAAFYAMFLLTMFQVRTGSFWKFNLICGAVLLAAAALARVRLREEPLAANTYLTQGLLLVTVGIIAKFSGLQLALLLGLESVVLWITGTMRRNLVMRTGACVSAALASVWAFDGIEPDDSRGVWLGAGVGGLMVLNALWSHWRGQGKSPHLLRAATTYFSALGLFIWSFAIWQNVADLHRPAAFALLALVSVATIRLSRLRELGLLAQLLLPLAGLLFIANQTGSEVAEPFWVFGVVAGIALGLVHWWQRQSVIELGAQLRQVGQLFMALIVAGVTGFWLEPLCDPQGWLLTTSALVLAFTAYGAVTRNGVLAAVGQGYAVLSVVVFLIHTESGAVSWLAALAPLAALAVLALGGRRWAQAYEAELPVASQVQSIATWYGRVAMALVLWWTFQYADTRELVWSFTALGAVAFVIAGRFKSSKHGNHPPTPHPASGHPLPIGWGEGRGEGATGSSPAIAWNWCLDFLVFSAVLNVCAGIALAYQLMSGSAVYWANFASIIVWMVEQQAARRLSARYPVPVAAHNVAMVGAGVALWWLASRWVAQGFSGFYLTASWSVYAFAIFAAGMVLRERIYRWVGLGILGAAMARVVIFDVWKLDTLYRILSFFALGLVLLVLGFIYNKYQERIRQWL